MIDPHNIDVEKIVTVDFESFYSSKFSLTNHSTSEYIRSPEFLAQCVGVKMGSKKTKTFIGKNIRTRLAAIDWTEHIFLAHNTAFDGLIMSEIYGIVPSFYLDTMGMTRGLHNNVIRAKLQSVAEYYGLGSKIAGSLAAVKGIRVPPKELMDPLRKYCAQDVDLTYMIALIQLGAFPGDELELIDMTIRMFTDGKFLVDTEKAQTARDVEIAKKELLVASVGVPKEELSSSPKFARLLQAEGVKVPMKPSPSNRDQMIFAFAKSDPAFQDLLDHENLRVARLTEARLAVKSTIGETRSQRLIDAGANGAVLPVGLNYCAANTFRWGGSNSMNLMNLPSRGDTTLRNSIIAPPGYKVLAGDSKQIEARIIAWASGHKSLLSQFASGEDVYVHAAAGIYGLSPENVTDAQRFVGKCTVLGAGFGMGSLKFQTMLAQGALGPPVNLTFAEADKIIKAFRRTNKPITDLWAECDRAIFHMIRGDKEGTLANGSVSFEKDTLWMPNGLSMNYPGLHTTIENDHIFYSYDNPRFLWGGTLTENIVQCLARIIIGLQMIEINRVHRVYHMVHDEIVNIVKDEHVEGAIRFMQDEMRKGPAWAEGLPLDMDFKVGDHFE